MKDNNDIGIGTEIKSSKGGIRSQPVETTEELVIHATFEKRTANYFKYIPQLEEDPPEFLPNTAIYVGNHLVGVKRVVIVLDDNKE
jgi:hypothetical protein